MQFEKEDMAKDHKFDLMSNQKKIFFPPYLKFVLRTLIEQIFFIVFSAIWIHAIMSSCWNTDISELD